MTGRAAVWLAAALAGVAGGCVTGPKFLAVADRPAIDRTQVEFPNDLQLTPVVNRLSAPVAIGFETDDPAHKGAMIIAESGQAAVTGEPSIYGFRPDGSYFNVYPRYTRIPLIDRSFRMYGPVTGMALKGGKIYVAHRDAAGMGIISAIDYEGGHTTLISDLPTLGDFGLTDVAIHPSNGRLYFGVGAATNSGVVGIDNFAVGWPKAHPDFCDQSLFDLRLNGFRFDTPNPAAGFFDDNVAVTGPFQPFGALGKLQIPRSRIEKPTSAIYSINLGGGDLKVEAHGIRLPRGLVFNDFGNLFVTNNGMELRGSRPVKDDPDAVLRVLLGSQYWYGFPDYSSDLLPISDARFKPDEAMLRQTGYPELAPLIDADSSGLPRPDPGTYVFGRFAPRSGAAKMAFVPDQSVPAFRPYRGKLLVTLWGDRGPFSTGGVPAVEPTGYGVKLVDVDAKNDSKNVTDFVVNSKRLPAHKIAGAEYELERPIDVKFGPDGALYILDYGQTEFRKGQERVESGTGRVYRLGPPAVPTTGPADATTQRVRNFQN